MCRSIGSPQLMGIMEFIQIVMVIKQEAHIITLTTPIPALPDAVVKPPCGSLNRARGASGVGKALGDLMWAQPHTAALMSSHMDSQSLPHPEALHAPLPTPQGP